MNRTAHANAFLSNQPSIFSLTDAKGLKIKTKLPAVSMVIDKYQIRDLETTEKFRDNMASGLNNIHLVPEGDDDIYQGYEDFQTDVSLNK